MVPGQVESQRPWVCFLGLGFPNLPSILFFFMGLGIRGWARILRFNCPATFFGARTLLAKGPYL